MIYKPVNAPIKSIFDKKLEKQLNEYEAKHGYRSMRVRPGIEKRGWIAQIEQTVKKRSNSGAFDNLHAYGMFDQAWEFFVLEHPHLFSADCIHQAYKRIKPFISFRSLANVA